MKKLLLLVVTLIPILSFAQGFQVNLAGQKQIGMGHTGTGLLQDGASVFFNPGALAMLPENSVQAGISPLFFKSTFNPTGTNTQYHTGNQVATPFSAYAVWGPKNSNWKFGLGVYTPFGGLADWGSEWAGKYSLENLDLKAIYIQPTISYKINKYISIGGGFVYNRGIVDLSQGIPLANSEGEEGHAEIKGSGHGYGWNAGVFIDTHTGLTIGLDYRSKVKTSINNGDAIFKVPGSLQSFFPQPNTFSASLPLPATATLGLGYKVSKDWLVALDVNFTQWNVYKVLAFDYAKNTPQLQDTYSPRNYKNAGAFRIGVQYSIDPKFDIRVGGGYVQSAINDGYVTPETPDSRRTLFTAGLGYKVARRLDLDLSFEYEHVSARNQTNIQTQLSGTFVTNVYIPGISLTYHW